MAQTDDDPLSRAIMRAIGWCDGDGGHGTGAHMVSTETLMGWAARAVLLESAVGPSAPAIATYRPEAKPNTLHATTCTTRIERNLL